MLQRVDQGGLQESEAARGRAFARFALFRSFASVKPYWRQLEASATFTPYQSFDFLRLWHECIGTKEGVAPLIGVAFAADETPLCLLPLGKFTRGPFPVGRFLAGKHANYNFGLWRGDRAYSPAFIQEFLDALLRAEPDLAALELHNQPYSWHGVENPFLAFAHQPSPSSGYRLRLGESGEAVLLRQLTPSYRSRIRGKEKKLGKLPGYRYFVATTTEEVTRCMDAFFVQKRDYMAALKIPNPFDEPEVEAFLRAAADARALEIHALECNAEVLALYAGVVDAKRMSTMISSYTASENARWSPGIITLSHMVDNVADRGLEIMDLGVGEAEYKRVYCDEKEALFDSFIPLSSKGHALVPLLRAQAGLKRFVKTTPALWSAAQKVRGLLPR